MKTILITIIVTVFGSSCSTEENYSETVHQAEPKETLTFNAEELNEAHEEAKRLMDSPDPDAEEEIEEAKVIYQEMTSQQDEPVSELALQSRGGGSLEKCLETVGTVTPFTVYICTLVSFMPESFNPENDSDKRNRRSSNDTGETDTFLFDPNTPL